MPHAPVPTPLFAGISDFVVGDPSNDDFGSLGGSIKIYSGLTGVDLFQVWGGTNDRVGASVCGIADVTGDGRGEVAYGYPGRDGVVVYSKSGSTPTIVWSWTSSAGSSFGAAVADAGDVDADGVTDVIVGAPGYDPIGKADVGRAYVFSGASGGLLWFFTGSNSYDYFASSVDGVGDLNGDGHAEFMVGCDQDDTVLALIARVIDQHLAGCLQEHRIGRWRNEALDHLLARISPAMQARVRQR